VTLYGKIDAGLTYVNNEGGGKNFKFDNSVLYGNRWGLKGAEDLGGGTRVIFDLESGFNLGNGKLKQGGAEFGRQAWVGIESKYGTLTAGNQHDFTNDYVEGFNVSGWASGYAIHQGDFDRMNGDQLPNSIKYRSSNYSGLDFGAMWSFGNQAGAFHKNAAWSGGAEYAHGPVKIGVAYTYLANPTVDPYGAIGVHTFFGQTVASVAGNTATDLNSSFALTSIGTLGIGASYKVGSLTLLGNFTDTTLKLNGAHSVMHVYEGGATYQFGPEWLGVVGYQHTGFEGNRWNQASAGVQYALSKRTSVYVSGDYLKSSAGVDPTIGYSFAPSLKGSQMDARIGMFTAF
jgi:outer membrane protein OmpU